MLQHLAADCCKDSSVADGPLLAALQGVQLLLDGVTSYLPCPLDADSYALDAARDEEQVRLLKSRSGALPAASCFLPLPVFRSSCFLLFLKLAPSGLCLLVSRAVSEASRARRRSRCAVACYCMTARRRIAVAHLNRRQG